MLTPHATSLQSEIIRLAQLGEKMGSPNGYNCRTFLRRLTRLTNAFSKRIENLIAALWPYFAHYNFVRVHGTLRVTPAMAAGVTDHVWDIEEMLQAARA